MAADERPVRGPRIPPDDLARLEREVARRASGVRLPGPEAKELACEVCGAPSVRWGRLCTDCRERLRGGTRPAGDE